ncbi:hypothetical protein QVD99_004011 [Batrachochytrium dendrobatidis]|nr:hypothetical protein O5D80_002288 [Batrachochytrium dendrobatidis]KAK5669621.1 hypothetical protein QVD99_004011 [Batrachochytrium dendrobatidis]
MRQLKRFVFRKHSKSVVISEFGHSSYGCYTWPSAKVLAALLVQSKNKYAGKHILELGAGTALAGLTLAKVVHAATVVFTDHPMYSQVIQNLQYAIELNHVQDYCTVKPLIWGDFSGSIAQLLQCHPDGFDVIIGADVMYDPKDFEILLSTVSVILKASPPDAVFLMTYQERSSRRSIQWLLDKWGLCCQQVHLDLFDTLDWMEDMMMIQSLESYNVRSTENECHKDQYDIDDICKLPIQQISNEESSHSQSGITSVMTFEIRLCHTG